MSDRERVEAEARKLYPADDVTMAGIHMGDLMENCQTAFIVGRTVTDEQVEAAAKAICRAHQDMDGDYPWDVQFEDGKEEYRDWARAALIAAGLLIEGDHHD